MDIMTRHIILQYGVRVTGAGRVVKIDGNMQNHQSSGAVNKWMLLQKPELPSLTRWAFVQRSTDSHEVCPKANFG